MAQIKILSIANERYQVSIGQFDIEYLNTDGLSMVSLLEIILEKHFDCYFIVAESKIDGFALGGIEIIKHIRLTPELGLKSKLPIIMYHFMSIDYFIRQNIENIILYSSAIYLYRLPLYKLELDSINTLQESLKPFLFGLQADFAINEHSVREENAMTQLINKFNNAQSNVLDKPLSYKKVFYSSYPDYQYLKNEVIESFNEKFRILLIDDKAEQWANSLKSFCVNTSITCLNNQESFEKFLALFNNSRKVKQQSFLDTIEKIQNLNNQFLELKSEIQNIKSISINTNTKLDTSKKNIQKLNRELENLHAEFKSFIQQLLEADGLLDILISQNYLNLSDENRKEANRLSTLISDISKIRDNLRIQNNQLSNHEKEYSENISKLEIKNEELSTSKTILNTHRKDANMDLETLFKSEFDCILVDLHFNQTKGSDIKESVGYKIVNKIIDSGLKIPIIIFSASIRELQFDTSKNLIYRFIKGMTPLKDFRSILIDIFQKGELHNQIEVVSNLRNFNDYFGRKYNSPDSPEYEIIKLKQDKNREIKLKLSSIEEKLRLNLSLGDSNLIRQNLADICVALGSIQELRIILQSQSTGNSYFKTENLIRNKISSNESDLRRARNNFAHSNNKDRKQKVNLQEISGYISTTYRALLYG